MSLFVLVFSGAEVSHESHPGLNLLTNLQEKRGISLKIPVRPVLSVFLLSQLQRPPFSSPAPRRHYDVDIYPSIDHRHNIILASGCDFVFLNSNCELVSASNFEITAFVVETP